MFSVRAPVNKIVTDAVVAKVEVMDHQVYAIEFAREWVAKATEPELLDLLSARPRIPRPLDVELTAYVATKLGLGLTGADHDHIRRDVRAAWWDTVRRRTSKQNS